MTASITVTRFQAPGCFFRVLGEVWALHRLFNCRCEPAVGSYKSLWAFTPKKKQSCVNTTQGVCWLGVNFKMWETRFYNPRKLSLWQLFHLSAQLSQAKQFNLCARVPGMCVHMRFIGRLSIHLMKVKQFFWWPFCLFLFSYDPLCWYFCHIAWLNMALWWFLACSVNITLEKRSNPAYFLTSEVVVSATPPS